jgi:hypothetical protein
LASGVGGVHAYELEEEVRQSDEVDNDNDNHAGDGFATNPECGQEKKNKGDHKGGSGETELDFASVFHDNEELDGEGEEEEEVELEKCNVNLRIMSAGCT